MLFMTFVPEVGISGMSVDRIPQNAVGRDCLPLPEMPAPGPRVLKCAAYIIWMESATYDCIMSS